MLYRLISLKILLLLLSFKVLGQCIPTDASKFFNFLNVYQKDSLEALLHEDFQLLRTYAKYTNNKFTFLNNYLTYSKAYNGKFKILQVINDKEPYQILVEDQSFYLKYLHVEYPIWKFNISSKDEKINLVIIDTIDGYQKYLTSIKVADDNFSVWLKMHYPLEEKDELIKQEGLLLKRLQEFSEKLK